MIPEPFYTRYFLEYLAEIDFKNRVQEFFEKYVHDHLSEILKREEEEKERMRVYRETVKQRIQEIVKERNNENEK